MSEDPRGEHASAAEDEHAAFLAADRALPFGPSFFLGHLGRFVRDHCPDPGEHLPAVLIRLSDGRTLELCHIIGVSPRWVMLAVHDHVGGHDAMAIELLPFECVHGVTIRAQHTEGRAVGFCQAHAPGVIGAETLLRAAMDAHCQAG